MNGASDSERSPGGAVAPGKYYRKGKDMWVRARTNALAQKLAAEHYDRWNIFLALVVGALTVIPIIAVGLSLHYFTTGTPATALPLGMSVQNLAILSIVANALALFLGLWLKDLKYAEKAAQHRFLLQSYSMIAQKVRRLEENVSDDDARRIYESLQEAFEVCKSSPYEPSDRMFSKAQRIFPKLKPLPFGLT